MSLDPPASLHTESLDDPLEFQDPVAVLRDELPNLVYDKRGSVPGAPARHEIECTLSQQVR
jgi:hypothetical protein